LCLGVDEDNITKVIHKIVKHIGIHALLIMWNIWCTRNKLVFDNIHLDMHLIVATIFSRLHLAHKDFGTDCDSYSHSKDGELATWGRGHHNSQIVG